MSFFKQFILKHFKTVTYLFLLVVAVSASVYAYKNWRDKEEERKYSYLIGLNEKYEQISKILAKLEVKYRSQKDLLRKKEQEWKEIVKKKDERIKLLSDITYTIAKHVEKQNSPDYLYRTPRGTRNFVLNELRIEGKDSPPIGYILIKSDGRTYKRNYRFEINVKSLQTHDEKTGKIKVYSKAFLVLKEKSPLIKRIKGYKNWKDTKYPLPITGGTVIVDPTFKSNERHFIFDASHINGGILANSSSDYFLKYALGVSFIGYGRSKNDLDYRFLMFGVSTDTKLNDITAIFNPVSYRFWPSVLSNTYLTGGINYGQESGFGYNIGIITGF